MRLFTFTIALPGNVTRYAAVKSVTELFRIPPEMYVLL